jgi:hypothetical protein
MWRTDARYDFDVVTSVDVTEARNRGALDGIVTTYSSMTGLLLLSPRDDEPSRNEGRR